MDGVLSIAVLHHISSEERRMGLLSEMAKIMKPGAKGLVTVWASEQEDQKKLAKWESLARTDVKPTGPAGDCLTGGQNFVARQHFLSFGLVSAGLMVKAIKFSTSPFPSPIAEILSDYLWRQLH